MAKHSFQLSDESINSHGFKVKTEGIDTTVFTANPVMLYEHSALNLIGRWDNVRRDGNRLLADADFDTDDELALKVEKKVSKGLLKGVSVGIQILKVVEEDQPDGSTIPVVVKSQIFEASICAIPSNANALRLYNALGSPIAVSAIPAYLNTLINPDEPNTFEPELETKTTPMKLSPENIVSLGLNADADEAAINAAIARLATLATAQGEQIAEAQKARVATLVAGAVTAGKITADKKEHFEKLATADFDATKAILDGLERTPKPTEMLNGSPAAAGGEAGRDAWTFDDWRKKDVKGLMAMKTDKPDGYAALLKAANIAAA